MHTPIILSVVIPFTALHREVLPIQRMIERSSDARIELIFVHDVRDKISGNFVKYLISQSKKPEINFIEGKFGSAGSARNAGMNIANGKWIAFWDADDYPNPDLYIKMIQTCESEGTNLCIGSYVTMDYMSYNETVREIIPNQKFDWLVNPGLWRCVFRSTLINETQFTSFRLGEDVQFLAEVISSTSNWSFFQPIVYKYVTNRNGQATSVKPKSQELITAFSKLVYTVQKSNINNSALYILISSRVITLAQNPNTYFGCFGLLATSLLSGKLNLWHFISSLIRVLVFKRKHRGA
jgi:glycosyltransferase involved in cell wall biosynthesis